MSEENERWEGRILVRLLWKIRPWKFLPRFFTLCDSANLERLEDNDARPGGHPETCSRGVRANTIPPGTSLHGKGGTSFVHAAG